MNVQEFVHESLLQIATAIYSVNETFELDGIPASANPSGALSESGAGVTYLSVSDTHNIEFDIAVTVTESAETTRSKGAGFRVAVVGGSVGGTKATETTGSTVSRLKFSVPLRLPRPGKAN